jgi:DNA-binding MarR family transcriptional regulator
MESNQPQQIIGLLFRSLHFNLQREIELSFRSSGLNLSFGQIAPMIDLSFNPGCNGAQLARQGMVSAQSMNSILRRLETEGFVERRPHPESLRADSWHLSEQGATTVERASTTLDSVFAKMLSSLNETEIQSFQQYLRRSNESLGDKNDEGLL